MLGAHRARGRAESFGVAGDDDRVWLVIADRVLEPGRVVLARNGWGWLDRRGHLRIDTKGLFVDTAVGADREPGPPPARRFPSWFAPCTMSKHWRPAALCGGAAVGTVRASSSVGLADRSILTKLRRRSSYVRESLACLCG